MVKTIGGAFVFIRKEFVSPDMGGVIKEYDCRET